MASESRIRPGRTSLVGLWSPAVGGLESPRSRLNPCNNDILTSVGFFDAVETPMSQAGSPAAGYASRSSRRRSRTPDVTTGDTTGRWPPADAVSGSLAIGVPPHRAALASHCFIEWTVKPESPACSRSRCR
jgi:hypothetical protein